MIEMLYSLFKLCGCLNESKLDELVQSLMNKLLVTCVTDLEHYGLN